AEPGQPEIDVDDREHPALLDQVEDARVDHVDPREIPAPQLTARRPDHALRSPTSRREACQPCIVEDEEARVRCRTHGERGELIAGAMRCMERLERRVRQDVAVVEIERLIPAEVLSCHESTSAGMSRSISTT